MHTSKVLNASDFEYWHLEREAAVSAGFDVFCPHYHEQDRIGVVSPCLQDGILYAGYALLAITTAFYDVLRSRGTGFFDYPHHFALLGADERGINTRAGRRPIDDAAIGAVWGGLDVWPDSNWLTAPGTASGMLKKVFDLQINRLFWPHELQPSQGAARLPAYVRDLLRARLKTVTYYNSTAPNWEIRVTQQVEDVVWKSIERLPGFEGADEGQSRRRGVDQPDGKGVRYVERYRQVTVDEFLNKAAQFESL